MAKELVHLDAGAQLTQTEDNALDRHYMTGGVANDMLVYDATNAKLIGKTRAEVLALLSGQAAAVFTFPKGIIHTPMTQPGSASEGELIYNSGTDKLNLYTGSSWVVIPGTAAGGADFTGKITQAWTTTEATAGEQGFAITTTDSVVQTAGIIQSLLVDHNITGAKSSTAQTEAISVDMNIGANVNYAYPIAVYVSQTGNPDISGFLAGAQIYLEDMGAGTLSAIAGLDIQIGSTNLASSRHTGIRLVSHTGTAKSGILFEKAWTVGIDFSGTGSGGSAATFATADIRFQGGTTLLDDGTDLTLAGANLNIGSGSYKTTNLLINEEDSSTLRVRNAADSLARSLLVDYLGFYSALDSWQNAAYIRTGDTNNDSIAFHARDTGVGYVEVARMQGAADPYFSIGGSQEFKFYYSGVATFGALTLGGTVTLGGQIFSGAAVFGSDGGGTDVTLYGGTASNSLIWDASENVLNIASTMKAADNVAEVIVTDATTLSSGYGRGAYIGYTVSGSKTGSYAINGLGIDMTISEACPTVSALEVYTAAISNKTVGNLYPMSIYCEDIGTGVSNFMALDIGINSTNLAASRHTGIRIRNHSGTATSAILIEEAFTDTILRHSPSGVDLKLITLDNGSGGIFYWDDSEQLFRFNKGIYSDGAITCQAGTFGAVIMVAASDATAAEKAAALASGGTVCDGARSSITIEDCEDAWNELVDGDVTASLDAVDYKVGSGSAKFICAAGLGAGDIIATEAISSTDLSDHKAVQFWFKSTVALRAGDIQLLLDDHANCASPAESLNFPRVRAAAWTYVSLVLANPGSDTAIISVGLKYIRDLGAVTINIDHIEQAHADDADIHTAQAAAANGRVMLSTGTFKIESLVLDTGKVTGQGNEATILDTEGTIHVVLDEGPNVGGDISEVCVLTPDPYYACAVELFADEVNWEDKGTLLHNLRICGQGTSLGGTGLRLAALSIEGATGCISLCHFGDIQIQGYDWLNDWAYEYDIEMYVQSTTSEAPWDYAYINGNTFNSITLKHSKYMFDVYAESTLDSGSHIQGNIFKSIELQSCASTEEGLTMDCEWGGCVMDNILPAVWCWDFPANKNSVNIATNAWRNHVLGRMDDPYVNAGLGGTLLNIAKGERLVAPIRTGTWSGDVKIATAGENVAINNICYLKSDAKYWKTDADDPTKSAGKIAIALETIAADADGRFLQPGGWIFDSGFNLTPGGEVYLSVTAGAMSQTAPVGAGDIVRIIGYGDEDNADNFHFLPNGTWIELA